ncbi:YdgA family protein [Stutzerimonas urumqiensis]|uniref:YdgA family protein n=1 Tax=Stutzerimonas urumqiensis TaxID=638269 RepID=UPI003BAA0D36
MKKLALAIAVPVALFGAATFYTSTQVEPTAREAVDQANVKLREMSIGAGADVSLKLLSFDHGLMSSAARYQVDIKVPDEEGTVHDYSFVLTDRLEHGPFPVSRISRGQLMPVAAHSHFELERTPLTEKLFEAAAGEPPLVGDVSIGYDGGQHGDLRSAAFNLKDEEVSLRVSPAMLNFEAGKDATTVRLDGELPEVDLELAMVSGTQVRMSVRNMALTADKQKDDNGFALGPAAVTLQRMEIQTNDEPAVVFHNASIDEALSQGSRGLDQTVAYRIGQVDAQGQTFSDLVLALSLRNLDAASLKTLVDSYKAVLESAPTPEASIAGMNEAQQSELQAKALQLLEHQPTLGVDELGFKTAHGAARLSVALDLRSPNAEAFTPDAMIASMVASLKADAGVDKGLIQDIASMVALRQQQDGQPDLAELQLESEATTSLLSAMAVDAGWSRLEGERLVSSLHYADDQVNFNGQAMSVPEFMGFAFGSVQNAGLLGQ